MKQLLTILCLLFSLHAGAQHHDHAPAQPKRKTTERKPASTKTTVEKHNSETDSTSAMHEQHAAPAAQEQHAQHDSSSQHSEHENMNMSHAFSLTLPMTRNGSGTSWLPDASPMFGYMMHSNSWMFMLHGNIFLRYNKQDLTEQGSRGGEQWDAPSMVMFMGQRRVGRKGLFHFNSMFSFDAMVTGAKGYPLLFQSGETFEGQPLVDRQHPHDLFGELSVSYAHAFGRNLDAFLYLGYPGEPALGPATFMHRPSGMDNPDAPLSHHWVDATHITFGVATLGLRYRQLKLEMSSFTGREPDEDRYDFDKPRFDSRSARLSLNPAKNWALQVSHAYLKNPETLHPGDVYRTTASATYAYRTVGGLLLNATALWGMNKEKQHDGEHAALLETSLRKARIVGYTRYEWVQKSVDELALDEETFGHDMLFPVQALTLGAAYDLLQLKPVRTSIGAQFTVYKPDEALHGLYGKNPMAAEVYLRIYPSLMQ